MAVVAQDVVRVTLVGVIEHDRGGYRARVRTRENLKTRADEGFGVGWHHRRRGYR